MSHFIEFAFAAFRIPAADAGTSEDQFLAMSLGGDNNVITKSGGVARNWNAVALGSHQDVIRRVCHLSSNLDSGGQRVSGSKLSAEGYIGKFRRLLESAPPIQDRIWNTNGGPFSIAFKFAATAERMKEIEAASPTLIARLRAGSQSTTVKRWYMNEPQEQWDFPLDVDSMKKFFAVLPVFRPFFEAWSFVEVSGPGCK